MLISWLKIQEGFSNGCCKTSRSTQLTMWKILLRFPQKLELIIVTILYCFNMLLWEIFSPHKTLPCHPQRSKPIGHVFCYLELANKARNVQSLTHEYKCIRLGPRLLFAKFATHLEQTWVSGHHECNWYPKLLQKWMSHSQVLRENIDWRYVEIRWGICTRDSDLGFLWLVLRDRI